MQLINPVIFQLLDSSKYYSDHPGPFYIDLESSLIATKWLWNFDATHQSGHIPITRLFQLLFPSSWTILHWFGVFTNSNKMKNEKLESSEKYFFFPQWIWNIDKICIMLFIYIFYNFKIHRKILFKFFVSIKINIYSFLI